MAYEYTRKINNVDDLNSWKDRSKVRTIITFRNQQLLDLWENEMSGQISDGMWENSSHTNWLWENTWLRLGNETKVEVYSSYGIGRRSFGMTKELWDCVGDRIPIESGFKDEKEAKAAWREIATAIYNAKESEEVRNFARDAEKAKEAVKRSQLSSIVSEWKSINGMKVNGDETTPYVYASLNFNNRNETCRDGVVRERRSYLFLHLQEDRNGNLSHKIEYHDSKWFVPKGKLSEAIEAIKEFDNKMRF